MNKEIQVTIGRYMKGKSKPSDFDLRCFVGMIETGEAIYEDFEAVGGLSLANLVLEHGRKLYKESGDASQ
jgi:hypothetical protein